jgi:hypothetical protein
MPIDNQIGFTSLEIASRNSNHIPDGTVFPATFHNVSLREFPGRAGQSAAAQYSRKWHIAAQG